MRYHCPSKDGTDYPAPGLPTLEEIEVTEDLRLRLELKFISSSDLLTEQFGAQEYEWAERYNA